VQVCSPLKTWIIVWILALGGQNHLHAQTNNRTCTGVPFTSDQMREGFSLVADDYIRENSLAGFSVENVLHKFTDRMKERFNVQRADLFIHCFPTADRDWNEIWDGKRNPILDARRAARAREEERSRQALEQERLQYQLPKNVLRRAYSNYIFVKTCSEARQGYQMVYINDIELGRAKVAAREIEKKALTQDSTIDKESAWNDAVHGATTIIPGEWRDFNSALCQAALQNLLADAPQTSPMKKDF